MYSIVNGAIWAAIPKWVYAVAGALLFVAVGLGIWCYNLNKENEHLLKVEWLYRYERVSYDAEGIRNMMLREEAMMVGNRLEQDSIKEMTIRLERRKMPTAPMFISDHLIPGPPNPTTIFGKLQTSQTSCNQILSIPSRQVLR